MNIRLSFKLAALVVAAAACVPTAHATDVTGAGASFVFPVMTRWSNDYQAATQHRINYQSIGSGGGIAQIKAGTVDFGSSDAPLKPKDLADSGLLQFPSVIGGVVPVANVPGLAPGALKLTGPLLADMFLGKIKSWNDPALVALNPELKLPALPVRVIHRSDGSGTTYNFVNYLGKVSPEWKAKVGEGTSVKWPAGYGGKGNEGVAAYVKQIKGGIGYVEMSYVMQNKMAYATLQNADGNFVAPSAASFAAAATSADWKNATEFSLVMTNAPGAESWPITATNFILMHKQPEDAARATAAKEFFRWVYASGDAQATKLHYVPLTDELVAQVEAYWAATAKF
jgi:phosphate transport system substrate-binding protein